MKLFGPTSELTPLATLIINQDIDALEKEVSNGWDINKKFIITKHIEKHPLTLALCENKQKVIDWLLSKNVELNDKESPAILMACSNCNVKTIKRLVENGATINTAYKAAGQSEMSAALYGNNYEAVMFLLQSGYDMKSDGNSLRQAVSNRQYKAIDLFLNADIDVNFCKPNMVFPYNSTPVHVAAENNDLATVKLLVQHGANVTIKDKYGERPYNCAVENKNEEMMLFLKSQEPEQWHNEEQRLLDLKNYKIPTELLQILCSEDRKIELPGNEHTMFIVFSSLLNAKEVNWKKHKFLDLLSEVDNYDSGGFLVWYPKKKCLAHADYEHEEFKELCNIKEFFDNPAKQIEKIFE
ncbi:MAG: ankyrin repeat domain-containing protein [Filimonas sp.]|nr:ankyrin repeat domain-containing protein [Filimonas sp.]